MYVRNKPKKIMYYLIVSNSNKIFYLLSIEIEVYLSWSPIEQHIVQDLKDEYCWLLMMPKYKTLCPDIQFYLNIYNKFLVFL